MGYSLDKAGQPVLAPSFFAFLDILGYRQLVTSPATLSEHSEIMRRLSAALVESRQAFSLEDRTGWYDFRSFTDNIVLAIPFNVSHPGEGEGQLGTMMLDTASYQLKMTLSGFPIRGGISLELAYVDDVLVYGPALIEAHELESKIAKFPRIILSDRAKKQVSRHVSFYAGGARNAPHDNEILVEGNEWFINYLDGARLDGDPDLLPGYEAIIIKHRDTIAGWLHEYERAPEGVKEKYLWSAAYHNYVTSYLYPHRSDLQLERDIPERKFQRLHETI